MHRGVRLFARSHIVGGVGNNWGEGTRMAASACAGTPNTGDLDNPQRDQMTITASAIKPISPATNDTTPH